MPTISMLQDCLARGHDMFDQANPEPHLPLRLRSNALTQGLGPRHGRRSGNLRLQGGAQNRRRSKVCRPQTVTSAMQFPLSTPPMLSCGGKAKPRSARLRRSDPIGPPPRQRGFRFRGKLQMPTTGRDQRLMPANPRSDQDHRAELSNAASAGAILLCATGVAVALLYGLKIDHVATVFLAAVLMVAVLCGLMYGLLAAVGGVVAYHLLIGLPLGASAFRSQDTALLVLFGAAIVVTGRYTDLARKRSRQARSLLEAARPLSPHASGQAIGAVLSQAKDESWKVGPITLADEAQRVLVSFCVVGAGLVAASLTGDILGPSASLLCVLAAILVVAATLGGRFGFAAGIFAALIRNTLLRPAGEAATSSQLEAIIGIIAFAAIGWGVGLLADRLAQSRKTLENLVAAGRDLTSNTEESAVREVLLNSIAKIAPRGRVLIADENGRHLSAAPTPGADWVETDPRWRAYPLQADGRDVGVVRWRFPGSDRETGSHDEIAISLIELGASAIVRARLNAEKSDMEFVARTEYLRTILLDAVSHHFRSPLAGILGSVTGILNLPDQHDGAVRRELLLIIKEQTNRLSRYVDNFLSVARLESGSVDVRLTEVSLEPLIYDVWETFGEAGGARRFLQARIDARPLQTDPGLLAQVLGNVLENAIKYSPEESVVDVRSWQDGDRLVLQVTDQGPGIPEGSQARIFERFYRSQAAKAPGLGLGLYIARSLVEMLGGGVEARNRTDGETGLVVSLTLPMTRVDDE
jgi:K+-sensing histidine kinase KdpD